MSTRDSGVIDLFAIQREEAERRSAAPSAPPPAVALDIGGSAASFDDVEGFGAAAAKSRKRVKLIGAVIGATAVFGIVISALVAGGSKAPVDRAVAAAAPPPPPVAATLPAVPVTPTPAAAPAPLPPPTADPKADTKDANYTRSAAIAAYGKSQGKKTAPKATKKAGGGPKLQKVQSAGVPK